MGEITGESDEWDTIYCSITKLCSYSYCRRCLLLTSFVVSIALFNIMWCHHHFMSMSSCGSCQQCLVSTSSRVNIILCQRRIVSTSYRVTIIPCQHHLMSTLSRGNIILWQLHLVATSSRGNIISWQHHLVAASSRGNIISWQHPLVLALFRVNIIWWQHPLVSALFRVNIISWQHPLVSASFRGNFISWQHHLKITITRIFKLYINTRRKFKSKNKIDSRYVATHGNVISWRRQVPTGSWSALKDDQVGYWMGNGRIDRTVEAPIN